MALPLLLHYGLLLVLLVAAYFDYRFKKIPDVITSSGWFLMCLSAIVYMPDMVHALAPILLAGLTFGVLFFVNALVVYVKNAVMFSWGDLLLIPVYAGYVAYLKALSPDFLTALVLPFFLLFCYRLLLFRRKDMGTAFAPFLFVAALIVVQVG